MPKHKQLVLNVIFCFSKRTSWMSTSKRWDQILSLRVRKIEHRKTFLQGNQDLTFSRRSIKIMNGLYRVVDSYVIFFNHILRPKHRNFFFSSCFLVSIIPTIRHSDNPPQPIHHFTPKEALLRSMPNAVQCGRCQYGPIDHVPSSVFEWVWSWVRGVPRNRNTWLNKRYRRCPLKGKNLLKSCDP